jgi:hypothetical protein
MVDGLLDGRKLGKKRTAENEGSHSFHIGQFEAIELLSLLASLHLAATLSSLFCGGGAEEGQKALHILLDQ